MTKRINFKSDVFFAGSTSKKIYTTEQLPYRAKEGDIVFDSTIGCPVYYTQGLWKRASDDTTVKNVVLDVYILAGETNMLGSADKTSGVPGGKTEQTGMFYSSHHETRSDAETTQVYSDWSETVDIGSTSEFGTRFGPEIGFVSKLNDDQITLSKAAIVKYTVNGSEMSSGDNTKSDWDSQATGTKEGDCWRGLQSAITDATTKLTNDDYAYRIAGLIFWQGESGADVTKLETFVSDFRSLMNTTYNVTDSDKFPVVITQVDAATEVSTVASNDDYVTIVDAGDHGQSPTNILVGATISSGNSDVDSSGVNDMFEIGEEFALKLSYAAVGLDTFWTPAAISTRLWLDADDKTQWEIDALNKVTQLNDKSGTNSHMTLVNATTGVDAGNNILIYQQSNDANFIIPNGIASGFMTHDKQQWFIVLKPTSIVSYLSPTISLNGQSSPGVAEQSILFSYGVDGKETEFHGRWYCHGAPDTWRPATQTYTDRQSDLKNQWSIISPEWDIANAKASHRLNGNDVIIDEDFGGSLILSSGRLRLFEYGDNVIDGEMGEIIITTNTSTMTRQKIEGYLAHKWGLTGELPAAHPYKTTHP